MADKKITELINATSLDGTEKAVVVQGGVTKQVDTSELIQSNLSELTNDAGLATETYVDNAVAAVVDSAPGTLDTLNELADALGDDPNFATTVATQISEKVAKAGDTMTGTLQIDGTATRLILPTGNAEFNFTNIGKAGFANYAAFAHKDNAGSSTDYSLIQSANGRTILNSASGQELSFRIGNDQKMVVDTTGNVGIGTNNPSSKLEVRSTDDTKIKVIKTGSIATVLGAYDGGESRLSSEGTNGFTTFYTGSSTSEKVRIDESGNVGIGTASPGSKLTVQDGDISLKTTVTSGDTPVYIKRTDSGQLAPYVSAIGFQAKSGSDWRGITTFNRKENSGFGDTSTVESMRIDETGNVGIGTDNPVSKLDVRFTGILGRDRVARFEKFTTGDNAYLDIFADNQNNTVEFISTGTLDGGFKFGNSGNNNQLVINNGNVGIGTDTPTSKLEIKNTDSSTGQNSELYITQQKTYGAGNGLDEKSKLIFAVTDSTQLSSNRQMASIEASPSSEASSANGFMTLNTRSSGSLSEAMRIDGDGNVGIGTDSPSEKLHVNGNSKLGNMRFAGDNTTNYIQSDLDLKFSPLNTSAGTRMTIKSTGNVGIGTDNPLAKLHVYSDGLSSIPTLGSNGHVAQIGASTYGTLFGTLNTGKGYIQQGRVDGTATDYGLLLQPNGGNVGIGTDSPQSKLHIEQDTNSLTKGFRIKNKVSSQSGFIWLDDDDKMRIDNASNSSRSIILNGDGTGNVGIGTDSPDTKLHVKSDNFDVATFERDSDTSSSTIFINNNIGDGCAIQGNGGGGGMSLATLTSGGSFAEKMRIRPTGNVGIGITNPGAKLEVDGTIKATDINFTGLSTFADEASASSLSTGDMYKTSTGELRIKL